MSDRDQITSYLGLPADATFSEIEHAYIVRCNSTGERLAAGDESARVELAALRKAFGRLTGRSDSQVGGPGSYGVSGSSTPLGEPHLRVPAWWECYLSLLAALASVAALVILATRLPHVYREGGFAIPLGLIVSAAFLSILGSMLSDAELQHGRRMRVLRRRGIDKASGLARLHFQIARAASYLSRGVRWLIVPALIVTVFFNLASLSGHWSIRK
jgi:hypothetical protein